jgi:hypothetical protein
MAFLSYLDFAPTVCGSEAIIPGNLDLRNWLAGSPIFVCMSAETRFLQETEFPGEFLGEQTVAHGATTFCTLLPGFLMV